MPREVLAQLEGGEESPLAPGFSFSLAFSWSAGAEQPKETLESISPELELSVLIKSGSLLKLRLPDDLEWWPLGPRELGHLPAASGLSPGMDRRTSGLLGSTSPSTLPQGAQMVVAELTRDVVLPGVTSKLPATVGIGTVEAGSTFRRQREGLGAAGSTHITPQTHFSAQEPHLQPLIASSGHR